MARQIEMLGSIICSACKHIAAIPTKIRTQHIVQVVTIAIHFDGHLGSQPLYASLTMQTVFDHAATCRLIIFCIRFILIMLAICKIRHLGIECGIATNTKYPVS